MNKQEIDRVLEGVKFGTWTFHVEEKRFHTLWGHEIPGPGTLYLQVRFNEADIVTGEVEEQAGRKWILSPHMKKSEIVTTAFKAVLTAMEHEVREQFRYRGRMVFAPHFDVDKLWEIATRSHMEVRDDPKSVRED